MPPEVNECNNQYLNFNWEKYDIFSLALTLLKAGDFKFNREKERNEKNYGYNFNEESKNLMKIIKKTKSKILIKFLPKMLEVNPHKRIGFKQLYEEINYFILSETSLKMEYFLHCKSNIKHLTNNNSVQNDLIIKNIPSFIENNVLVIKNNKILLLI